MDYFVILYRYHIAILIVMENVHNVKHTQMSKNLKLQILVLLVQKYLFQIVLHMIQENVQNAMDQIQYQIVKEVNVLINLLFVVVLNSMILMKAVVLAVVSNIKQAAKLVMIVNV